VKVIQIVGRSNAGKTTFMKDLIRALSAYGTVGAVKHLGHHHGFQLEPGKDTTAYYESDAAISSGVDDEKSVFIRRENDLDSTLQVLCNAGIEYAVLEGFKARPFPRIVIGDLQSENVVLRNPSVDEVIAALPGFEDYYTTEGLVRELRRECGTLNGGVVLTFSGPVKYPEFPTTSVRKDLEAVPGIIGARLHHQKSGLHAGEDRIYIAILAEQNREALAAAGDAIDRLKRKLP
jgi:molybdopterin synthase catalytic subunit